MVKVFFLVAILSSVALLNSSFLIKKKKKKKTTSQSKTKVTKKASFYNDTYSIVVDKSDYELQVFDREGWLATYPVVFGKKGLGDKMMEGDQGTPEGTFRITFKNPNHKWERFMQIDYPNAESYQKFYNRKANGQIPENANIGGSIGIHGTWPGSEHVIDNYINWTEGCISMKNSDVVELFEMLPMHTKITIKP